MDARTVKIGMNRCGKAGIPFLFGVDFELKEGFFVENPLHDSPISFVMGDIGGGPSGRSPFRNSCLSPGLEVLEADAEAYRRRFDVVREGILRGDSFLLNLTERTPVRCNLSLEEIFYRSKARYRIYMPGRFVCFSPEIFIRIKDGIISSYPMKGTLDATLPDAARVLMENYKETCEHNTIVDLIRNDLNQVAERVEVKRFRYMEEITTLKGRILQTSSEICGKLPDGWKSALGDLVFRLLPAGSISGAPKRATLELIRRAEGRPRGFYTGVCGYFDGENLDSAVMIRFIEQDGDRLFFRSGGGITVNSLADEEYAEVLEKIYLSIPL